MYKEIFDRMQKGLMPFKGYILRVDMNGERIPLRTLREIIQDIFVYFEQHGLIGREIFKCADWLQHDGFLSCKEKYSYKKIAKVLKSDEFFYESRRGEHAVRTGYYNSMHRWYIRVYIVDKYDRRKDEDFCGDFDLSICDEHIMRIKSMIEVKYFVRLTLKNAQEYFQRITIRN